MDNLLLQYFQQRMEKESGLQKFNNEAGPVITITREYGCPGKIIAQNITSSINDNSEQSWRWISKEIMESLAHELNLQPSVIKDLKNFDERKTSDYLALFLTGDYYPGEKKIRNTLSNIVLSFANQGNVVIVGRAGYQITNQIERSFHISLKAPIDWRIEHICQRFNITYLDGLRQVEELSQKRKAYLDHFNTGKEYRPYDLVFDCSKTSNHEIIDVCLTEIKKKGFY